MIRHIKIFFYPPVLTYSYNKPKEIVIDKISAVLSRKTTFLGSHDITGMFLTGNMFYIRLVYPMSAAKFMFGSTLVGDIIESRRGMTEIKTKARPSFGSYFLFFIAIISGAIYIYKFIQTGSGAVLFWSLLWLFLGPALSIGLSNVGISHIHERYKMYIDKDLKA